MSGAGFKDHFSAHAREYSRYRPGYPDTLFAWLKIHAPGHNLAWDAGCGNGQVAAGLSRWFGRVHASDPSVEQIARATPYPQVSYHVEPAETCSLPENSADLVTVGQALHWFKLDEFYAECQRVLRPGGLVSAWTYELARVTAPVDRVIDHLYSAILGQYWPAERVHVENGYTDLEFPFREVAVPEMVLETRLNLDQYLKYIGTWSAVRRYVKDRGKDPVNLIKKEMKVAWRDPDSIKTICWPLAIRVGFADS